MRLPLLLVTTGSICALVFACSSTVEGTGTSGAPAGTSGTSQTTGATTEQISSCRASCDKMKRFDCLTAQEQSDCYAECSAATPTQIESFNGCANASLCDPACRTSIGGQTGGSSGSSGTSGTSGTSGSSGTVDLTSCNYSCDQLSFFECPNGESTAKACKARCAAASSAQRNAFNECIFEAGSDCPVLEACWSSFQ